MENIELSEIKEAGLSHLLFQTYFLPVVIFGYPVLKFLAFLVKAIFKLLMPMPDLKNRYCGQGKRSWAMVTGATDGIGLGFSKVLAKMGFNLVLISRNSDKLSSTVQLLSSLQSSQRSQFKTIAFDFRESSNSQKMKQLLKQLEPLDICMLVNNVGTNYLGLHQDITYEQVADVVNINCVSMTVLTACLVKKLNERGKSGIINVSSLAGDRGIPYLGLYSASKSFTNKLTQGLGFEYPNVEMLSLRPVLVESGLSRAKRGLFVPTGQEYALSSLKQLIYERQSYGTFSHQLIGYVYYNLIPNFLFSRVISVILQKLFMIKRK